MLLKKKRTIIAISAVFVGVFFYLMLRPTYKFTEIEIKGCPHTFITKIEYWKLGERGVVFAYGKLADKKLSDNNAVIYPNMSGFDAMYQIVISCNDGKVIVNYISGYFKQIGTDTNISHKRLKVDEFSQLLEISDNSFLEGY